MTASQNSDGLAQLRLAIDHLDDELVALFAKRFAIVNQVVEVKKAEGLPAAIPERVAEVVARVKLKAETQGFPAATAEKLWRLLIADMIEFEEQHLK